MIWCSFDVLAWCARACAAFDFTMVVAGYTAFIPTGSGNTSGIRALRALRALRPLRSITRFESLRAIVVCFLEAVPLLGAVVSLLLFVMLIFAIAGTAMFTNTYRYACYDNLTGLPEENEGQLDAAGCGGWRSCPAEFTCEVKRCSTCHAVGVAHCFVLLCCL